ncbi:proline-specific permease ProY [Nostoc sp. 3335mG]|nr:proline-specific permease ProY [Nostoc sp. 3335mG]
MNDFTQAQVQVTARDDQNFVRELSGRHVQLIAIGGAIGVGLFLGSGSAIAKSGPGLIAAYAVGGIAIFFIMRALGELLTYRPVAGSFASYAEEFVGPFAGFVTGWSYWFMWVVVGMAELTAIGVYFHFWFPHLPQWIPALTALAGMYAVNLVAVKLFGEFEFWFALIKVVAIVAMMAIGLVIICFGYGELGPTASFSNLWAHGGIFPTGVLGVVLTLQIVMFAYQGVELIGVTAGEAANPERELPRAINGVIYRILIFYIGALVILMALLPWDQFVPGASPFVLVFEKVGIPAAGGIINFVVITAAASSCNSGVFSTGRMLHALAQYGQAPKMFGRVSKRHVPANAISASAAVMLIGVALNYFMPGRVFEWLTSVSVIGGLWTWGVIMFAHLRYRQEVVAGRVPASPFRMPGGPITNWSVIGLLLLIVLFLSLDESTRVALYVAPLWFGLLAVCYRRGRTRALTTGQTSMEQS